MRDVRDSEGGVKRWHDRVRGRRAKPGQFEAAAQEAVEMLQESVEECRWLHDAALEPSRREREGRGTVYPPAAPLPMDRWHEEARAYLVVATSELHKALSRVRRTRNALSKAQGPRGDHVPTRDHDLAETPDFESGTRRGQRSETPPSSTR